MISVNNSIQYNQKSRENIETAMDRLTSALKVSKASDDAAGLAISSSMTTDITQANSAHRNLNYATSTVQTTDSALGQQEELLQRVREIGVKSSNGILSPEDRNSLRAEASALISEIDEIAKTTDFNGTKLLDGQSSISNGSGIDIGLGKDSSLSISTPDTTVAELGIDIGNIDLSTPDSSNTAIEKIDIAIEKVRESMGEMGAYQSRIDSMSQGLDVEIQATEASRSRIRDTDYAMEISELNRNRILEQSGLAMQVQANQSTQNVLALLR